MGKQFLGIANQDQEVASIADCWVSTSPDMKDELLCWLEDQESAKVQEVFCRWPVEWVRFIQQCAATGLRQAVLESG